VLVAIATVLGVVAGYAPSARAPLLALDVALGLLALLDLLLVLPARVEVERHAAAIFSVGRPNPVTLRLRNRGGRALAGAIVDDPLGEAEASGLPGHFELAPHGAAALTYEITPTRRGPRRFEAITLRYPSLFGLVARQERTALPAAVDVYPDVHAARALELLRRQGRQDVRLGSMRVRGGDTEFERLRPYARGDEIRHVSWKATARRDDLTVRQFQAESDQNVMFALDVGRSMRGEWRGLSGVDHALNAALLVADVAIRAGDKAGLIAFDDVPRTFLPPSGGRSGARKLTRAAYALEPGLAATDYRAATTFLSARMKARALVVVFTNLLEPRAAIELASALRSLQPRHLPLCVLLRDEDLEQLALVRPDTRAGIFERAAAGEALAARDAVIRELRHAGAIVVDAAAEEVTAAVVRQYLEIKARRLL
jgi:uncharacterized protein (DUF58 family)